MFRYEARGFAGRAPFCFVRNFLAWEKAEWSGSLAALLHLNHGVAGWCGEWLVWTL